jgi:hypothetical protein
MKIAAICPITGNKEYFYDWLYENTIKEVHCFCNILDGILRSMLKGKCYKRYMNKEEIE